MGHTSDGVLRRLLDEPAAVADTDRAHAAGCPRCLDALAAIRADAALADAALATEPVADLDVDAAARRLSAAVPGSQASRPARGRRPVGVRALVRRPVVVVAAAALVLTGVGAAAANGWFPIFHTEKVAPVELSTADLVALPDLSGYGDLTVTAEPEVHQVADAAAAAAATGLDVPTVTDLRRGIRGEPQYQVGGQTSATFTFSADKAARAAAAAGGSLPPLPAGLDGSEVRLVAGPGVAQIWSSDSGAPGLVVGRAVAPTAYSSGVPFETVRDYLLSLPGLPANVAAE